ncbi:hypothetical protein RVY76_12895 [Palleronia sp. LCG004]|nr:hypothetical protein [Palleronia sp. LCG004]WOI55920.1 hypothetical protein RVY76_12895 [Palleronia sp. LCG004]
MSDAAPSPQTGSPDAIFAGPRRSNWVRLRTLILLRWIAIAGQVTAVLVAEFLLDLVSHNGLIALAISAAVITNVAAALVFPENQRVSERGLVCVLVFDMVQLSTLLMLTGGLNNPFASLILAQVAISAAVLRLRAMVAVCTVALLLTTVNLFFYMPLQNKAGDILEIDPIFRAGFWAAIMTGVIFQASYARRVTLEMTAMADALSATQMALAREQKLTDLGGVVAAAAHELGTPLATIALVSGEMIEEAPPRKRAAGRCPPHPRSGGAMPRHPSFDGPGRKAGPAHASGPAFLSARGGGGTARGPGNRAALRPGRRRRGGCRRTGDPAPPRNRPRHPEPRPERRRLCRIDRLDRREMDGHAHQPAHRR